MQFQLQESLRISCLSGFGRARYRFKRCGRGVGIITFVMTQNHPFHRSTRPLIRVNISFVLPPKVDYHMVKGEIEKLSYTSVFVSFDLF